MKTTVEMEKKRDVLDFAGTAGDDSIAPKRESAMRRYFYNCLASYLSLYIRPENTVVEIAPRSEGLSMRFTKYRAVSSVAALKTTLETA